MENNLENWTEVQLIDVLETLESGSRPRGGVRGIIDGIPSIGGEHLDDNGGFDFSNIKYVPASFAEGMNRGRISERDILIVKDGATTGKTSFVDSTFPHRKAFVNEHVFICRVVKQINSKYVYWFLKSKEGNKRVMANFKGSAQGGINQTFASNTLIPIAPLAEQRRIVAKLDELMEKIDRSRARLERIPKILKRFRQSVLSAAVSGKLTEDWRNNNTEIRHAQLLIDELINSRRNKGSKVKLNFEKVETDVKIPAKWSWTQILNISEIIGGVTKGRKFNSNKTIWLPYLRVANVQDGYLDLNEIKKIEVLQEDLEKYKLIKGDILFTEGGDRDKLGRGTVWNDEIENCIHQNHIFRARTFKEYVLPRYISYYARSEHARSYFFEHASQTVNLASINLTTIARLPIPVPPIEEQREIVRKVDRVFLFADKIEARYNKAKLQLDQLTQSLLGKAFRGELVSQYESDEPASELLKRIDTQISKVKENPKRRKVSGDINPKFTDVLSFLTAIKKPVTQEQILENVKIDPIKYFTSINDLIEAKKIRRGKVGSTVTYTLNI